MISQFGHDAFDDPNVAVKRTIQSATEKNPLAQKSQEAILWIVPEN